jgi:hypothetical protein
LWKTDDSAGPAGRARIRTHSQKTSLRLRRQSRISTTAVLSVFVG